jgi:hypothetical protein
MLLAVAASLLCQLALAANNAVVTSAVGMVQAQAGSAPARAIRTGDELTQGDTIFTGPQSSVVLKFDDGQVAALTANSRMTITTYNYNPATQSGSSLLSLVNGGMRAITGLLGKKSPDRVAFRAATATIGIRGTDFTIAVAGDNVVVTVKDGAVTFTMGTKSVVIPAGQAVRAEVTSQRVTPASAADLAAVLSSTPEGQAILNAINGVNTLDNAINNARPGLPRQGGDGQGGPQGGNQGGDQGGNDQGGGSGTSGGSVNPTGGGTGGGSGSGG